MFHKVSQKKRTRDIKNILYSRYYRALEDIKNKRPRLCNVTMEKINTLKNVITVDPYKKYWNSVKYRSDIYVNETPPEDLSGYDTNTLRGLGDKLPYMALCYLITEDDIYLDAVKTWMDAFCSYPEWCGDTDIGAATVLYDMCFVYDWLHNFFSKEDLQKYKTKIIHHASILYEHWLGDNISIFADHGYRCILSIGIAGKCLYGEYEEAKNWLYKSLKYFLGIVSILSKDGAPVRGPCYWGTTMFLLVMYSLNFEFIVGKLGISKPLYFQKYIEARYHMSTTDFKEVIGYGDGGFGTTYYDYGGPTIPLIFFGNLYRCKDSYNLKDIVEDKRGYLGSWTWLPLLLVKKDISGYSSLKELNTFKYFRYTNIVVNRKSWDIDDNTNYLQFIKCGFLYGSSHIHPDEGHFLLYAYNYPLIVDDGYSLNKQSSDHNLVVPNGYCQLGGNHEWFKFSEVIENNGAADILYVNNNKLYKYIIVDPTKAYPIEADLASWVRTIIFLPKGYLVVRDDVQLNSNGYVDSYLHFNIDGNLTDEGSYFLFSVDDVRLEVYDVLGIPSTSTINREFKDYLNQGDGRDDLYLKQTFTDIQSYIHVRTFRPYNVNLTSPEQLNIKQSNENILEFEDNYLNVVIDFNNKNANVFEKIIF